MRPRWRWWWGWDQIAWLRAIIRDSIEKRWFVLCAALWSISRCLTIRKSVMYRTKMRALSAIYRHIITVCCCSVAWANSMVGGWRRVESCTEPIRCTCPKRCSLAQDCVAWWKTPEGPIIIVVFSVKVRSTSPQQPEMRWSLHMQFVTIKMCRRKSWGIFIVNAISS